ncbi:histone-lysine N-methyltransferase, H3 lysine-36 specific-like [Discoglossus pictus]
MEEGCELGRLSSAPGFFNTADPNAQRKCHVGDRVVLEPPNGCNVPLTSALQSGTADHGQDPSSHYIPLRRLQDLASMINMEGINGSQDTDGNKSQPNSQAYFCNSSEPAIHPSSQDSSHRYSTDLSVKLPKNVKNGNHPFDSFCHMEMEVPDYGMQQLNYTLGGHGFDVDVPVYGQPPTANKILDVDCMRIGDTRPKINTPSEFASEIEDLVSLDWTDNNENLKTKTTFLSMIPESEIPSGAQDVMIPESVLEDGLNHKTLLQIDNRMSGQRQLMVEHTDDDETMSMEEETNELELNNEACPDSAGLQIVSKS